MSFNFDDYIKLKLLGKTTKRVLDLIDESENNNKKELKSTLDYILEDIFD
ncbi:hypothetical protein [Mycoplasma capricolum]